MKGLSAAMMKLFTCLAVMLFGVAAYVYADLGDSEGVYCDSYCASMSDYGACMQWCCQSQCMPHYPGANYDECVQNCKVTLALCDGAANADKSCNGTPNGCMLDAGGGCWQGLRTTDRLHYSRRLDSVKGRVYDSRG
jgi:hypothetical protein